MVHVIFALDTQVFIKINDVYGNLKDQMKHDLCMCEALATRRVPRKLNLWAWQSITTNINYANIMNIKDSFLLPNLLMIL